MGTVAPSTNMSLDVHKQIMQEIILPTVKGLDAEGRRYQGVLYAGLMMTDSGPKVLEYNARFGDPETQVIMARMTSDIVPVLKGVADGQLGDVKMEWTKEPAVCVVLAAGGYPNEVETGKEVKGLAALKGLPRPAGVPRGHRPPGRQGRHGGRTRARHHGARPEPRRGGAARVRRGRQDPLRRHAVPPDIGAEGAGAPAPGALR